MASWQQHYKNTSPHKITKTYTKIILTENWKNIILYYFDNIYYSSV